MRTELVILLVAIVVVLVILQRRRRRPIVLGTEHARAQAMEEQRLARGTSAPSPMPKESYAPRHNNLVAPNPIPLDSAIRDVVAQYRTADAAARAVIRDSVSGDEIYTLLTFAQRAAVFGLIERDRSWVESGLTAVAMFDVDRMDPRDVMMPIALLHHASRRLELDTAQLFADVAALAESRVASAIAEFPRREETDLREHWLQEEIATGFIGRGLEPYAPARDVTGAIIRIAQVIDADARYEVTGVEIADELPPVWIEGSERLLEDARGAATIHTSGENGVMVFLAELAAADAAAALQERASRHKATSDTAMVGIARGNLFCLIVARAFIQPSTIDETPETLQRFVTPVAAILDTAL